MTLLSAILIAGMIIRVLNKKFKVTAIFGYLTLKEVKEIIETASSVEIKQVWFDAGIFRNAKKFNALFSGEMAVDEDKKNDVEEIERKVSSTKLGKNTGDEELERELTEKAESGEKSENEEEGINMHNKKENLEVVEKLMEEEVQQMKRKEQLKKKG
jgi:hypothetical protein